MASAMIGNLAVSLTMSTAAFQRGATLAEKRTQQMQGRFASATTSVKGLGTALGVTLGADVLYRITSSAFEMASSLQEAASRAGVTVEVLQRLRLAAQDAGVSNEKLEASLVKLSRSVAQAETGSKSMVTAIEQLGLTVDDLAGKTPDQQFRLVAEAYSNATDKGLALAASTVLMGRGFAALRPLAEGGAAALDEASAASQRNGEISTEDAKKLDELADSWGRLKTRVGVATANVIAAMIPMVKAFDGFYTQTQRYFFNLGELMRALPGVAIAAVSQLVSGIQNWIANKLGAIWAGAVRDITRVGAAFRGLYESVVGHSDIPDMVDGIAAHMARLDAVMVEPVNRATTAAKKAFRDMASEVGGLLDRLFPELRAVADLARDTALIGQLPAELQDEADRRLRNEFFTGSPQGNAPTRPDFGDTQLFNMEGVTKGIEDFIELQERLGEKAEDTALRIAKSFKDMAEDTLSSLSRLTSAIKGGGFLGILEAVIGFGLQLGSMGVFGSGVANRLNGVTGGSSGFLSPARGNSGKSSALVEIVDTTGLFVTRVNGQIQQAAPTIARAGVSGSMAALSYQQSRRVG